METEFYPIGLQFKNRRSKNNETVTIVDIHRTYNSKNELIKVRYVGTHKFMGQDITDYDINTVSIARSLQEVTL